MVLLHGWVILTRKIFRSIAMVQTIHSCLRFIRFFKLWKTPISTIYGGMTNFEN